MQTLSYYEFVEAMARIAEKLAIGPVGILKVILNYIFA